MLQRKTQTATFWRDQFEVTPEDLDYLYTLLLDTQSPKSTDALGRALIEEYLRREDARMQADLAKGEIYQPKGSYQVGQTLVFPALDFRIGTVQGVRPGRNPEHGDFQVLNIYFEDRDELKEFASKLSTHHRLSQSNGMQQLEAGELLSAAEIYLLYQEDIQDSLLFALEEGPRHAEFVQVNERWLLADMLDQVHVGQLNIAEALIEMQGRPMKSSELLSEVELDPDIPQPMQIISLDFALGNDERFDQIGNGVDHIWYLRRLEPVEARQVPLPLAYRPIRYNRALLSVELLQLEWELDDEWGESSLTSSVPSLVSSTSFTLTYPHLRSGTIPLSGRTRNFFPQGSGRSMVTLIDGRWSKQMTGWVVHEGRYVCGLGRWMEEHLIPVGAFITLERAANADEIVVDFRSRRPKREWTRVAATDEEGNLTFKMGKVQIGCDYDEYLIVSEGEPQQLDALRQRLRDDDRSLEQIVDRVVQEFVKLSLQGNVHAKTVYSAVNMVRRCPPGPIFHALMTSRRYSDLGGGLFALA